MQRLMSVAKVPLIWPDSSRQQTAAAFFFCFSVSFFFVVVFWYFFIFAFCLRFAAPDPLQNFSNTVSLAAAA